MRHQCRTTIKQKLTSKTNDEIAQQLILYTPDLFALASHSTVHFRRGHKSDDFFYIRCNKKNDL